MKGEAKPGPPYGAWELAQVAMIRTLVGPLAALAHRLWRQTAGVSLPTRAFATHPLTFRCRFPWSRSPLGRFPIGQRLLPLWVPADGVIWHGGRGTLAG